MWDFTRNQLANIFIFDSAINDTKKEGKNELKLVMEEKKKETLVKFLKLMQELSEKYIK